MFQEVGSALQIDIQDLFQISLYDTPVYPNLEKQFAKKNVRYFESGRNAVEYIFRFVSLQIRRLSYCQNFCVPVSVMQY